jgi:glycosyltransferase involved in cell wall biosynthesis
VSLIQHAKFLVCPYRDASQSGVLMTAMAIGKPVIATNVGAFPEYIQDGYNGLVAEPNHDSILDRVLHYLEFDRYKEAETYINPAFSQSIATSNQNLIAQTYFNE